MLEAQIEDNKRLGFHRKEQVYLLASQVVLIRHVQIHLPKCQSWNKNNNDRNSYVREAISRLLNVQWNGNPTNENQLTQKLSSTFERP